MKISAEKVKMYESILQAFGPSGCEYQVVTLLKEYYQKYTSEIIQDNLGELFCCHPKSKGDCKSQQSNVNGTRWWSWFYGLYTVKLNDKKLIRL